MSHLDINALSMNNILIRYYAQTNGYVKGYMSLFSFFFWLYHAF